MLCFALGFLLAAVSPAVLVPSIFYLMKLQRGTKKGIPSIMLAASSFDDIYAINTFSIFVSIAFSEIGAKTGEDRSIGMSIFINLL